MIFSKKYSALLKNSFTDELTGLKNYKALEQYLTEKITIVSQGGAKIAIILIDIDNFKNFNSDYGYNTADQVLKSLGELLGNDKRITDETFRYYLKGDEFLIVASDTNLDGAYQAAERKRNIIEKTDFIIGDKVFNLTVSCGVTECKKNDTYKSITDRAGLAVADAKLQPNKNFTKTNY